MAVRAFRSRSLPQDAEIKAEEAAALLGYTRREIYRRLNDGVIPGHKVGARWFLWRADVERLRNEGTLATAQGVQKTELLPSDVLSLLAALAGEGEVTFEVTVRRKCKAG